MTKERIDNLTLDFEAKLFHVILNVKLKIAGLSLAKDVRKAKIKHPLL